MSSGLIAVAVIVAVAMLGAGTWLGRVLAARAGTGRVRLAEERAVSLVATAEADVARMRAQLEAESARALAEARERAEAELDRRRRDVERIEERVAQLEETLEDRRRGVDRREVQLAEIEAETVALRRELGEQAAQGRRRMEEIAGMSAAEASDSLTAEIEEDAKRAAMRTVREVEREARVEAEARARKIVSLAVQRIAQDEAADATASVLSLPNEEMKGRIIGKEGRNIRSFEAVTGVNLVIDDTPGAVTLSCFDPVRREIGRLTLEMLVADGRIHPSRIEETYEKARGDLAQHVTRAGEWAVLDLGITDMHPDLVDLLGRLRFRTSYGQTVLLHLVESAHVAGIMAAELGIDGHVARRGTLLHDIGKAVSHEVEGSHAVIGAEVARRLQESPEVCHCIEAHHGEVEARTIEAVLTQAADAVSGGRPGARRESLEAYVKRLERLEGICESFPGVEKAYAMQAGRDVRVMVRPSDVDDIGAQVLARDVAKAIESELQYPGQIRITVVRESRTTEYAR